MISLILSSLIITSSPNEPTEIIGSAATPDGARKEITIQQPPNTINPFGYIAPSTTNQQQSNTVQPPITTQTTPATNKLPNHIINQALPIDPPYANPIDYENKIENTIYQDGNRLIDIQSIPLKDISTVTQPNIQPTITNYPAW